MPAAIIPAIIGAGASIGSSLLNKKKSSSGSTAGAVTSPLDPSITALNTKLGNLADYQLQQGQQILPQALSALQKPADFYSSLLSGDRNAIMQLLGPQINSITQRGAQQQNTISQLLPRGGRLNDRLGAQSTADTAQINDAILGARPAAASSLAGIGQTYGGLAQGLVSGSGSSLATNLSSLLGQRGQDVSAYLQKYQQQQEDDRSLGKGIGSLLALILDSQSGKGNTAKLPIRPTNWPIIMNSA